MRKTEELENNDPKLLRGCTKKSYSAGDFHWDFKSMLIDLISRQCLDQKKTFDLWEKLVVASLWPEIV